MARRTSTFSLSPEVKEKWLTALRSGKFKQGSHCLYSLSSNSYCCLGVLGRVIGVSAKSMWGHGLPNDAGFLTDVIPTREEMPANCKFDPANYAFSVLYNGRLTPLSELNDVFALNFKRIADLIEAKVPTH